jgi:TRAP transporter TAXI family solute receptor
MRVHGFTVLRSAMKRKKYRLSQGKPIIITVLLAALSQQTIAQHDFIAIGTGDSSGVYFQAGNAICRTLHKEEKEDSEDNIRCISVTTGGSVDNIRKVATGKLDFSIVQSDVQHHGYVGETNFTGSAYKNLRAVLSLHSEPFHLLVRNKTGITGWDDLKGKRINMGSPNSGIRATFDELMAAYGVDLENFDRITELTPAEQSHALCKGRIDAYGNATGAPSESVAQVIRECNASVISLDSPVVNQLISSRPYFDYLTIPAGSYEGVEQDIHTFGAIATVVTSAEVDERVVYELVQSVFKNIDQLREVHPAFADLELQQMACRGNVAPLHDGAKKYFAEQGLDKCP